VSAAQTGNPALRLASRAPVIVTGQHFRARTRIRPVPSNGPAVAVHASLRGTFRVTLGRAVIDRCSGFSLTGAGKRRLPAAPPARLPAGLGLLSRRPTFPRPSEIASEGVLGYPPTARRRAQTDRAETPGGAGGLECSQGATCV
jgi:hypothetical protein